MYILDIVSKLPEDEHILRDLIRVIARDPFPSEASGDEILTKSYFQFEIDCSELVKIALDKEPGFAVPYPSFTVCDQNGSHFWLTPLVFPNEIDPESGDTMDGCVFGLSLQEDPLNVRQRRGRMGMAVYFEALDEHYASFQHKEFPREDSGIYLVNVNTGTDLKSAGKLNLASLAEEGAILTVTMFVIVTDGMLDLTSLLPEVPGPIPPYPPGLFASLQEKSGNRRKSQADFTIVSQDGQRFPCHRCVLSLASDYFAQIVFGREEFNVSESTKDQAVKLGQVANKELPEESGKMGCLLRKIETKLPFSGKVIKEIFHWMYLGKASPKFDGEDLEVLDAADFLLMADVLPAIRRKFEESHIRTIDQNNSKEKLTIAQKYNFKALENQARGLEGRKKTSEEKAKTEKQK